MTLALKTSIPAFVSVLACGGLAAQGGEDVGAMNAERTIAEFSGSMEGPPEPEWFTVLDGVMGGRSSGELEIEDGVLRFRGVLNTNGGGFSSIRSVASRDGQQDFGLAGYVGLHLRVRGDGRQYSVRLEQLGERRGRRANYRGEFNTEGAGAGSPGGGADREGADREWQDVYLAFEDFVPTWRGQVLQRPKIDPSKIGLLGLTMADGKDGPFAIEVDSIKAYRPFDLDSLQGERRALVVFGPEAAHPGVLRLLVDLGRNQDECDDRDLSVVVVLEEGPSRIGERPLGFTGVQALRERFGIQSGNAAAVLVGKDGTETHRSVTLANAAPWFQRIDTEIPR